MAITAPPSPAPAVEPHDPDAGAPPSRPLGRHRTLPGSRPVVGGLLVTLAVLGTFVAYTSASSGPTGTVVVATHPLAAGDAIGPDDVRSVAADLPAEVRATFFAATDELEGAVALAAVGTDQAIPRSAASVTAEPDRPRAHEISFALERNRALNGRIRPDELVDLVATFGSGADASTEIVVRGVRVVELDAASTTSGPSASLTITVALDSEAEVLRTAHALEVASVTLSRSTGTTESANREPSDPVDDGSGGARAETSDPPGSAPTSDRSSSDDAGDAP